jgi:hypothetical protein
MSGLRSALEEWSAVEPEQLNIDQLADDLVELERVSGLLEALRLRWLEVFDRRQGHHAQGFPSPTSFLMARCGMRAGRAHNSVTRAHTLSETPLVLQAWVEERISTDQANELLRMASLVKEAFPDAEETLVGAVNDLTVRDTHRLLEYWRQAVDGPGSYADEQEQLRRRGVSLSTGFSGLASLEGELTTTCRELLHTALDSIMSPPAPEDERTPRQRRHDAMEDLARYYLDHTTTTVGGEKPHINIVCDLQALGGIAGGLHETEAGQVITVAQLRTLACDSSVSRIVLGPDSEVIDVGRRTRVVPTGLRRAIVARDRHCTWPGCDRSSTWADVHHDRHWIDFGPTDQDNCRLLCRYHHTLTHLLEETPNQPPANPRRHPRPVELSQAPTLDFPALVPRE